MRITVEVPEEDLPLLRYIAQRASAAGYVLPKFAWVILRSWALAQMNSSAS